MHATYDKTEGEPGILLDYSSRIVAAVVTTTNDALITRHVFAKRMLAAGKEEKHR